MMNSEKIIRGILYVASVAILSALCYSFVASENQAYTWDSRFYWVVWNEYTGLLRDSFSQWLGSIRSSVYSTDYNPLPIISLIPFNYLPIGNREAYILGVYILYLLPFAYIAMRLFAVAAGVDKKYQPYVFVFLASFIPFITPTLRGYPDIIGMIPLSLCCLILFKVNILNYRGYRFVLLAIAVGVLLWLPFAFRRWYAYSVVSLFITLPFLNTFLFGGKARFSKDRIFKYFAFFTISAVVVIFAVCLFQFELAKRILTTNYSDIYSAYKTTEEATLLITLNYAGLYLLPLIFLGVAYIFFGSSSRLKVLCAFALANFIITYIIFTRTQTPGMQHGMPLCFWLAILVLSALKLFFDKLKKGLATTLTIAFALLTAAVFISTYSKPFGKPEWVSRYLPGKEYPLRLENFDHYHELIAFMSARVGADDKVAVFASSGSLNNDLFAAISPASFVSHIANVSQVDLRDKLTIEAFSSRYAIVTDPTQTHLDIHGQQVISLPNNLILEGKGIGAAYIRVSQPFILSGGVQAYVYEKTRPYTIDEYRSMIDEFARSYPSWKAEYENNLTESYLSAAVQKGDTWGQFSMYREGRIYAHPGATTPTVVRMFVGEYDMLRITSVNKNCGKTDGVKVIIEDATQRVEKHIATAESEVVDMRDFHNKDITLIIDNNGSSACDGLEISQ
ncbi:hypothetical protein P2G42_05365 [Klebsiella electrica]|uniref:hypothetical protein n=1 Tax=Klebsiella electrica TaxID=1259973 RepID=UPI0025571102|nr:hypothetical protein [Klebsiella electrica]WIO44065.1 hypothetical protein P2G42_05365 [Klebsiella electrica]